MALRNLKTNNKIMIMKEDKGIAMIVMDTCDYLAKMEEHLMLGGSYKKFNKGPSVRIIKEVKKSIVDPMLTELEQKIKLTPKNMNIPRIYDLPKIHKDGIPFKPIVNTIGSTT